jgi:hypothetical protein
VGVYALPRLNRLENELQMYWEIRLANSDVPNCLLPAVADLGQPSRLVPDERPVDFYFISVVHDFRVGTIH